MARPLTNLLNNEQFRWNEEVEVVFKRLKHALTSTSTLPLTNFNEPFTIGTNGLGDGIVVFLTPTKQHVAYMNRALETFKKALSTYIKEMLTIVITVKL